MSQEIVKTVLTYEVVSFLIASPDFFAQIGCSEGNGSDAGRFPIGIFFYFDVESPRRVQSKIPIMLKGVLTLCTLLMMMHFLEFQQPIHSPSASLFGRSGAFRTDV
jgi:hypothetical protein